MTPEQLEEKREEFRQQVTPLLKAAETYVIAIIRVAAHSESQEALDIFRAQLLEVTLDAVELVKP